MNNKLLIITIVCLLALVGAISYSQVIVDQANQDIEPGVTMNNPQKPEPGNQDQITMIGKIICMPHKIQSETQTTECAFGIQETSTGNIYGINFDAESVNPDMENEIKVEGILFESDPQSLYDTVGYITVESFQPVSAE